MRKLLSFVVGFGAGAVIGAALVMLFAPLSGDQMTQRLKRGWSEALEAARDASETRRRELEAQLQATQRPRLKS
jgi:gas vesicle protein